MLQRTSQRYGLSHRSFTHKSAMCIALAAAMSAPSLGAAARYVLPPNADAYGQSLTEWTEAYWNWFYTGGMSATQPHQPGSAPLVFMPIPQGEYLGGSFTSDDPGYLRGTIEITVSRGTAFFHPCFAWIAEAYNTGQADDPSIPDDRIQGVATHPDGTGLPEVTLDGRDILPDFWSYYVGPAAFDPMVEYPEPSSYGSIAAIAFQGVGFIMRPLPPGTHVLHLFERLSVTNEDLPGFEFPYDLGVIYDNTWIIHVQ
jgi:hypothetical protein